MPLREIRDVPKGGNAMSKANGKANGKAATTNPSSKGDKGDDGRDPTSGKFVKGWKGGTGNPHSNMIAAFRTRWLKIANPDHVEDAYNFLLAAMTNDEWPPAVRLMACEKFLDRTIGKPQQSVELVGDMKHTFETVRAGLTQLSERLGYRAVDLS